MSARPLIDTLSVSSDGREYRTSFSYAGIAEAMRSINPETVADSHELYRCMILNILVGNVDDHLRNHGLIIVSPGQFRLSPAFDILPHLEAPNVPQSIGVGTLGRASTLENALTQCGRFFLEQREAIEIIREVKEIAADWRAVFRDADVSQHDLRVLAGCLAAADSHEEICPPTPPKPPGRRRIVVGKAESPVPSGRPAPVCMMERYNNRKNTVKNKETGETLMAKKEKLDPETAALIQWCTEVEGFLVAGGATLAQAQEHIEEQVEWFTDMFYDGLPPEEAAKAALNG